MVDFEDLALGDLLNKVQQKVQLIAETRNLSKFNELGQAVQRVYDFFVTASKPYEEQQPLLKNLFSSFNYGAVIINDAIKSKQPTAQSASLIEECLEIMDACCKKIKASMGL